VDVTTVVLFSVLGYQSLLLGIGLWASRRTKSDSDYFIGNRQMGPWITGISYSASASSAWTLLGVSGAAFTLGPAVVWVALGSFSGMLVAWTWVAPRLLEASHRRELTTFTEYLTSDVRPTDRTAIVRSIAAVTLIAFVFYIAAQFQGAGFALSESFAISNGLAIIVGATVILIYTWLGGYWAVSVTDAVQGVVMGIAALALPISISLHLGSPEALLEAVATHRGPLSNLSPITLSTVGFVIGSLSIGLGTFGQPHLMVRFMALKDHGARQTAARITLVWYLIVFSGMVFTGLSGRALVTEIDNAEQIFFALANVVLPPVAAGLLVAAVLSAIMSTADSQLLVCASTLSHDLARDTYQESGARIATGRVAVLGVVLLAIAVALWLPAPIFSRVLFAWSALGAALGPTLFARLLQWEISPRHTVLGIWLGFLLTVGFSFLPNTAGDILERLLPFFLHGLFLTLVGRR
jgi:sodium/proline symporter